MNADDIRDALTAGYVTDLEPLDLVAPYLPTLAERPYVRLDQPRQEHTP